MPAVALVHLSYTLERHCSLGLCAATHSQHHAAGNVLGKNYLAFITPIPIRMRSRYSNVALNEYNLEGEQRIYLFGRNTNVNRDFYVHKPGYFG